MLDFPKWKVGLILAVCLLALILASPNLLSRQVAEALPGWLPKQQISLGLDLQGGAHLLLEVDTKVVINEHLESLMGAIRVDLRGADIGYRGLSVGNGAVMLTVRKAEDFERARETIAQVDRGSDVTMDDSGTVVVTLSEVARQERIRSAVEQSIEIIRRRIDETGVREPTIVRQGDERVLVQLPGIDDPERIKSLLGSTAKMSFHLVDYENSLSEALQGRVPPGSLLLPLRDVPENAPTKILVRKRIVVSGENLVDAQPTFDQRGPVVSFRFDTIGGKKFGEVTRNNVNRQLAIVLDNQVISAPNINEPILGGSGIISGNFSVQETKDLALLLRAGALPAPLTVIEERTVGPGLGADSIAAGQIASLTGLVVVVVFMVIAYGFFGILANVALLLNLVMIVALLSLFQATLTLPGIAGIVLTVGMAVDANVLIFERMREEVRSGRGILSAVDMGYKQAIRTIVDANLTTLIAATLLFGFGSGPVRGFAVTLAIGILTSLFTATVVIRMVIVFWIRSRRPQVLPL